MRYGIIFMIAILAIPGVLAHAVGTGINVQVDTEEFKPLIWLCDSRTVLDDNVQKWRNVPRCITESGSVARQGCTADVLYERINNYAFEGEKIIWDVLIFDKNGLNKVSDVWVSIGPHRQARSTVTYPYEDPACMAGCASVSVDCIADCNSNATSNGDCIDTCVREQQLCETTCVSTRTRVDSNMRQANCVLMDVLNEKSRIPQSCNARILEEQITSVKNNVAGMYRCELTVETPLSMYGEYFVTLEVEDLSGLSNSADEAEYWFFNPVIELLVDGQLVFSKVRPGTSSYSSSVLVENTADKGSGVMMDMFISGTDFYDSSSSGAMCPTTNRLSLKSFRYHTVNGGYSTRSDPRSDAEGFVGIGYGSSFSTAMYDVNEIIQAGRDVFGTGYGYQANVLAPGSKMPLTFRLDLPEPCNGDFDTGSLFFWGEAI